MIIKSVHVKNFRCILDESLYCGSLTAMVGPNGVGKSCFLRALELFYAPSPRFGQDDFYNRDISQDIEITVTFTDLEQEAAEMFAPYLDGAGLSVTRVLSLRDGKTSAKFYGSRLQNPEFVMVRQAGSARDVTRRYNELRQENEYADLPAATSQPAALEAMHHWELAHGDRCTRQRDEGQFFGFTEVGHGYLGRFTRLVTIPAVRDAAEDASEGRGRPITEILDLVVRATLASHEEITKLKHEAQKQYDDVMAEGAAKELDGLENQLTETLQTYVPDAAVDLQWITEGGVEISMPKADVRLVEHGYPTAVARTGHGLQRAFILTMLQHLTAIQSWPAGSESTEKSEATEAETETPVRSATYTMPSLVLAIEEPELYQHPSRQRHLANILLKLASGIVPGVAKITQVLYSTHSPLFVGIDRFNQVRVLRKVANVPEKPQITKVVEVGGDEMARALWEACDRRDRNGKPVPEFTWDTLRGRLQPIMTPWMAEGFFADVVVLVEGEDDRASVLGAALARNYDFESLGVAVIPAGGKSSLDRPCLIFQRFGIPTYVIWDSDRNKGNAKPRENHILLRVVGAPPCDWPCGVSDKYACFETKLEDTVRREIGLQKFDYMLEELQGKFGYTSKEDAIKNPYVFGELLRQARSEGATSPTLDAIIDSIVKLKGWDLVL